MPEPDPDAYYPSGRSGDVQECASCGRLYSAVSPPICHACAMGIEVDDDRR